VITDATKLLPSIVVAIAAVGTPLRAVTLLRREGPDGLARVADLLASDVRFDAERRAENLVRRGVTLRIPDSDLWEGGERRRPPIPPMLFCLGDTRLLSGPAVGMCGSRRASESGLAAARRCSSLAVQHGLHVVSGNARGIDAEAHLGALRRGGATVIVLAEGIDHYRPRRELADTASEHVLVVSQFAPSQRWTAGAAMTRNGVIVGLGRGLVAVEAASGGGTLAAGRTALAAGRPVAALELGDGLADGSRLLLGEGAERIADPAALGRWLEELARHSTPAAPRLPMAVQAEAETGRTS
jgi:DNA processing protein